MAKIFGKSYSKSELLQRVGDISQIAGTRLVELQDGNEKGVRAVEFWTGSGFQFTVLVDRGLDISSASYCGRSLAWRSSNGDVAPAFFEPEGLGWLRTFPGGLLCTCGLTYCGAPCTDEGKELGLHGRYSHIPAKNLSIDAKWDGDEYEIWVKGSVRETMVFGENVLLTRTIKTKMGEKSLHIHDVVENQGFDKAPHMVLYHINGGFPVVDDGSELISPTIEAIPRDAEAEDGKEEFNKFHKPTPGYAEKCYHHKMGSSKDGTVLVALVNRNLDGGQGMGYYVKYDKNELPWMVEWKMMGQGMYVVGTEPSNCEVNGRDALRKAGTLKFLEPGQTKEYHLEIGVLSSKEEIADVEKQVRAMK